MPRLLEVMLAMCSAGIGLLIPFGSLPCGGLLAEVGGGVPGHV